MSGSLPRSRSQSALYGPNYSSRRNTFHSRGSLRWLTKVVLTLAVICLCVFGGALIAESRSDNGDSAAAVAAALRSPAEALLRARQREGFWRTRGGLLHAARGVVTDSHVYTADRGDGNGSGENNLPLHATATAGAGSSASSGGNGAVLTLPQACQHELGLYCGDADHRLQCLVEHYTSTRAAAVNSADAAVPVALKNKSASAAVSEQYSEVCQAWLEARDVCVTYVRLQRDNLCGAEAPNARECLRRVPPPLLPRACRDSDYYRSVRLLGKLRRQQVHQSADL